MSQRERVLVVDGVSDTAEVLQAVLEPRGLTVNRVCRLEAREKPSVAPPKVLVLDVDSANPPAGDWGELQNVPQVIIGTWQAPASRDGGASADQPERRYLQKPFQYAELVRAIETLIAR